MSTAIQEVTELPRHNAPVAVITPTDLLRLAVEQGADLDRLERLMTLQERWEAGEARKAYTIAMNAFKAEPVIITKRKLVSFTTRDGDTTSYKHAELSDVTEAIGPAMAKHDLSFRWNVRQEAGTINVDCIVTHAKGHSETVSMHGSPDASGKKNAIQQVASTVSYLQRYTLLAATGMSTKGDDDDGAGSEEGAITNQILDGLLEDLERTSTDEAAAALWASGSKTLHATGRKDAYDEFKEMVVKHRKFLKTGGAK